MTLEEIKELIASGEKINVEFKESRDSLNKDIFNSICSFNNCNGGHIFLGVNDNGQIIGVKKEAVDKIIKDLTTSINNPQKIFPPLYLVPKTIEIDGKIIIYKSSWR